MSYQTLQEKIEESAKKKLREKIQSLTVPIRNFAPSISLKIIVNSKGIEQTNDVSSKVYINLSDLFTQIDNQIFEQKTEQFIKQEQQDFLSEIEKLKKDNEELQNRIRHLEFGTND